MNNDQFLETLVTSLTQTACVNTVFGDPVQAGDKVIIPVAQVMLGTGGGYGHGRSLPEQVAPSDSSPAPSLNGPQTPGGGGGGGGLYASARGIFEITPGKTRFIAARDGRETLLILAVGFLLGRLLAPGRSKGAEH